MRLSNSVLWELNLPNLLILLAIAVWLVANLQVRREEGRWLWDTTDAILLVVLALYLRFA